MARLPHRRVLAGDARAVHGAPRLYHLHWSGFAALAAFGAMRYVARSRGPADRSAIGLLLSLGRTTRDHHPGIRLLIRCEHGYRIAHVGMQLVACALQLGG